MPRYHPPLGWSTGALTGAIDRIVNSEVTIEEISRAIDLLAASGPLDAPDFIVAGSVVSYVSNESVYGLQESVLRGREGV